MATSSPCERAASVTAARLSNEAISTRSQRSAAVTIARVPFVVDIASIGERGSRYSRGELPRSKPSIRTPSRSPPSVTPPTRHERPRVLDLGGAEHALVPARERLADRRRRADHVDHDTCRRGRRLVRCKGDVNVHAGTLAVRCRTSLHCYRHPDRETYVSCSECGRAICPDCMVFAPVGIRCPEHANVGGSRQSPQRTVRNIERATKELAAPGDHRADRGQRRSST